MNRKRFSILYLSIFVVLIVLTASSCKKEKPLKPNEEAAKRQTPDDSGEEDYKNGKGNIEYFYAEDSLEYDALIKKIEE